MNGRRHVCVHPERNWLNVCRSENRYKGQQAHIPVKQPSTVNETTVDVFNLLAPQFYI